MISASSADNFKSISMSADESGVNNEDNVKNKRRRSRKGLMKVYECEESGCGKKFTRLEHLFRHQLNHRPKEIFKCTWEGCGKTFVRQDLKDRHVERHEKRGPYSKEVKSNKRETKRPRTGSLVGEILFEAANTANTSSTAVAVVKDEISITAATTATNTLAHTPHGIESPGYTNKGSTPYNVLGTPSNLFFENESTNQMAALTGSTRPGQGLTAIPGQTTNSSSPPSNSTSTHIYPGHSLPLPPPPSIGAPSPSSFQYPYLANTQSPMAATSPLASLNSMYGFAPSPGTFNYGSMPITNSQANNSALSSPISRLVPSQVDGGQASGLMPSQESMDVDSTTAEGSTDLISWLFSDAMLSNVRDPLLSPSFYLFDSPMSLQNLLTPPSPQEEMTVSEFKRSELLSILPSVENYPDTNLFTLQRYIAKYWLCFHPQFPILHKPSFQADKCPVGLLWAIILLGAAFDKANDFALKVAEPLRWYLFGCSDFNPPARLWVIQSLLLLEVYEKTMSNRKTHERAHIHHGTTLQLIRRGSALRGSNSPRTEADPWKRWIEGEATKRAVLMAFVLDVFHATMFGHATVLSVHEIRLSLPCSENLWEEFPSEKGTPKFSTLPFLSALKMTLNKTHVDTGPFGRVVILSGLLSISYQMQQRDLQVSTLGWGQFKETYRNILAPAYKFWKKDYDQSLIEKRRSNMSAGSTQGNSSRTAGVGISTDHSSLPPGAASIPTVSSMTSFQSTHPAGSPIGTPGTVTGFDRRSSAGSLYDPLSLQITGCTAPFYHLAHITLRVGPVELQVYAGAPSTLNQPMHKSDYEAFQQRVGEWVTGPGGEEVFYHAIRFLREMYFSSPTAEILRQSNKFDSCAASPMNIITCPCPYPVSKVEDLSGTATPWGVDVGHGAFGEATGESVRVPAIDDVVRVPYLAREDPIIHRPNALFLCTLAVWAYGFYTAGPEADVFGEETATPDTPINGGSAAVNGESDGPNTSNVSAVNGSGNGTDKDRTYNEQISGKTTNGSGGNSSNRSSRKQRVVQIPAEEAWAQANEKIRNLKAQEDGYEYIRRMASYKSSEISNIPDKNYTVGLLRLAIESMADHQWDIIAEGARLLTHCIERSLGKRDRKCHYMYFKNDK